MEKKYHFLAGLPRSGNTLLSALLNQNPDIYSTPLSPVPTLMWRLIDTASNSEQVNRNIENKIRVEKFISLFMQNYYKDIKKPVIIERQQGWSTPGNLDIIKEHITKTPKIIFTVRDILEIIASFVKMDADYLKSESYSQEYYIANYRSEKDLIVEHIMKINGSMDKSLLALAPAFYPENSGLFHIVEYNDLVLKPDETMSKIYEFLEMPNYKHNFNKIEKVEKDNDEVVGLPKDLHQVRESLSESSTSTDILSEYIKNKYSNMEFWRNKNSMKVKGKDF
jgi:sulfotransferase